jgi:hypothetical protein
MKRMKRFAVGASKVCLALLGVILFPILIWVALGVAVNQRMKEKRQRRAVPTMGEILTAAGLKINDEATTDSPVAAKTFNQMPVSEVSEVLAKAGLAIPQEAATKHCWEILRCPPKKREVCPAHRDVPSWIAIGLSKTGGK